MGKPSSTLRRTNETATASNSSRFKAPKQQRHNPKGNESTATVSTSSRFTTTKQCNVNNKRFYIECRRVLPKKPLESFVQDGAEGLYIWFLSTWIRVRNKHFNSKPSNDNTSGYKQKTNNTTTTTTTTNFINEDEDDLFNSSKHFNTWRESILSTTTAIFDLDNDDDNDDDDVIDEYGGGDVISVT